MKKRYIFAGILIFLSLFGVQKELVIISVIFQTLVLCWVLYVIRNAEKHSQNTPLTGTEKQVSLLLLF